MPKRRRKRRKLAAKYKARRAMLTLLLFGLVFSAGFLIYTSPWTANAIEAEIAPASILETEIDISQESQESSLLSASRAESSMSSAEYNPLWSLMLVSQAHPLPYDFAPLDLAAITDGMEVDLRIAESLKRMFISARFSGVNLMLHSAYHSIEDQQTLFDNAVDAEISRGRSRDEAAAMVSSEIAVPGTEEHHTGLSVEILATEHDRRDEFFGETNAFRWLENNAHHYGFILRYPADRQHITGVEYRPWHFRYVGVEHAEIIRQYGISLEEYLFIIMTRSDETEEAAEEENHY